MVSKIIYSNKLFINWTKLISIKLIKTLKINNVLKTIFLG